MLTGQNIRHPRYGKGRVKALVDGGENAWVYFELIQLPRIVRVCELTPEGPAPTEPMGAAASKSPVPAETVTVPISRSPGVPPRPSLTPASGLAAPVPPGEADDAQFQAVEIRKRLTVECLRQGLPPQGNLADWTVGFRSVRNLIGRALAQAAGENGTGSVHIIAADYGQGKSHVGHWAQEVALSQRLMTMNAELDGASVTLTNGMTLAARLFASAVLPAAREGGIALVPGLGTILKQASRRLRGRVPSGLDLFNSFLAIAELWEANEEAVELLERYLSGDGKRADIEEDIHALLGIPRFYLPPLKTNWGRLEDRIKAQAQQIARVVRLGMEAGARGALIVLDEFDHELWYSKSLSWRAQEFLDRMCEIAERTPVVFLFLTPRSASLEVSEATRLDLPQFDSGEFRQVFSQAVAAYREAFREHAVGAGEESLFQELYKKYKKGFRDQGWGPRFFVRAAIEACDRAAAQKVPLSEVVV